MDKKILVVDDEEIINQAIIKIASSEGYYVSSVNNGFKALEMMENERFSLALCDIMMPEMDGIKLLKEIKRRKIPTEVIMISGYSTVDNIVSSLFEGAIDFIPKPFTFDEVMSSISRGFNYLTIKSEEEARNREGIAFVPCPPKYLKLGNTSWIYIHNEGLATIGITDLFLRTIAPIKSIELENNEDILIQANPYGKIICEDEMTHNLLSPISGKIIERNELILNDSTLLEKDPYFAGWIYKLIPSDVEYDTKKLLTCSSDRI